MTPILDDSSRRCSRLGLLARGSVIVLMATAIAGCRASGLVLTQEAEARRLVADLRVQFSKAADAANRAVMADTDEVSATAAREAEDATKAVEQDARAVRPILQQLGFADEIGFLDAFDQKFTEYRTLDSTILGLAVENTNLKAQRLSFGPAGEAADTFRASLDAVTRAVSSSDVDALAARAALAIREIQVLQSRHIAEPADAEMSRMEAAMAAAETSARKALHGLTGKLPPALRPGVGEAAAALDRFMAVNAELLALSRRNSNVRSLALSLGRKRAVSAESDDALRALQEALIKHEFKATR